MEWADIYARLGRDRNDALAWKSLERRVRAWARRGLRSYGWHVTEDAVADTSAAVALSLERARGAETFKGFVLGHYLNARQEALRALTPGLRLEPLGDLDAPAPPCSDPDAPSEEQRVRLRRALEELPVRERRAVRLRYYERCSAAQIGAALGVTAANARQIVFSGLRRLRRRLQGPTGVDHGRRAAAPPPEPAATGAGGGPPGHWSPRRGAATPTVRPPPGRRRVLATSAPRR
jgi:RNA polymerase sigma factor (sigma-70 family)